MAFCSFSKDCDGNSFVTVENKFITKYLPEADGFAVKVYLTVCTFAKPPTPISA